MKLNVGSADRVVRLVVAALLLVASLAGWITGAVAIVALALAAIFTLTALVRVCPLYLPFGLSTLKKPE